MPMPMPMPIPIPFLSHFSHLNEFRTIPMPPDFSTNTAVLRRAGVATLFLAMVAVSCFFLYRAADSIGFRIPYYDYRPHATHVFPFFDDASLTPDSEEYSLERVLKDASMEDNSVILTTLNAAWAAPNSVVDLFLESFRIGEQTRRLLNHLVIISLDRTAYSRCLVVHSHCFALITEGVDFSHEAYFMTPDYLKMMWRRIDFLRSVLEMGYNFAFTVFSLSLSPKYLSQICACILISNSHVIPIHGNCCLWMSLAIGNHSINPHLEFWPADADVMWFRDPFPHFYPDADFQIACDHFLGKSDDIENKPNGGFKFVRSNNRSIEFYKLWYSSREKYPRLHDQDVLNRIKNDSCIRESGLKMRFLDTAYFGGFCEPSKDLNKVCTMHANCCFGLNSKLHDLRILIEDWKNYMSLAPSLKQTLSSWRVPQNCSLDSLRLFVEPQPNDDTQILNRKHF